MARKHIIFTIFLLIGILFLFSPTSAAPLISTIRSGNTVFIGEQGLDITAAMNGDKQLGWWASGAPVSTSPPQYTITVSDPSSFSISPSEFVGHSGVWYHLVSSIASNGTAFTVIDPQIDLKVEDNTVNVDVTNKWVPSGDDVQFRIDSNLAQITQRTGVAFVPVTIKVQSPDGGLFTSLVNSAGTSTPLVDYPVTTTPQYTGSIWSTADRAVYPPGTYAIWVVCNVNAMNDNYGQTGKTISSQISLLNQENNPLINNKGYVTNPTTSITTVPVQIPTVFVTPVKTTEIITTLPTPVTTQVTSPPQTAGITESPSVPSPITTKASGFGTYLSIMAIVCGLVLFLKQD